MNTSSRESTKITLPDEGPMIMSWKSFHDVGTDGMSDDR